MEYSYKFRIYPNREQENLIQRTFGCCRFVFNHFLAERTEQYKQTGKSPTRFQQDKSLTALKDVKDAQKNIKEMKIGLMFVNIIIITWENVETFCIEVILWDILQT